MLSSKASVRGYFIEFIKKLRRYCRNFLRVTGLVRIESEIRILGAGWRAGALNLHTLPKNGLMSFSVKHKLIIWILYYFFHYFVFSILKFHNIVSCGGSPHSLLFQSGNVLRFWRRFLYYFYISFFSLTFLYSVSKFHVLVPPTFLFSACSIFQSFAFCSILYKLSST